MKKKKGKKKEGKPKNKIDLMDKICKKRQILNWFAD